MKVKRRKKWRIEIIVVVMKKKLVLILMVCSEEEKKYCVWSINCESSSW